MNTHPQPIDNRSAEPLAFALLQWPALVGVLALDDDGTLWQQAMRLVLLAWLLLTVVASYSARRGPGFGNTMLLLLACVAGAWWTHASAWMLLWLAPLLIGLYAAQKALAGRELAIAPAGTSDPFC